MLLKVENSTEHLYQPAGSRNPRRRRQLSRHHIHFSGISLMYPQVTMNVLDLVLSVLIVYERFTDRSADSKAPTFRLAIFRSSGLSSRSCFVCSRIEVIVPSRTTPLAVNASALAQNALK